MEFAAVEEGDMLESMPLPSLQVIALLPTLAAYCA